MNKTLILFINFFLVACSTLPKGRYVEDKSEAVRQDESLIKICRPQAFIASAITPELWIDYEMAATLSNGSVIETIKPAKSTQISFKSNTFNNPNGFGITVTTRLGEEKHLIMGADLQNLIGLPIGGVFLSGASWKWEVKEVSASIFNENCNGLKSLRIKLSN